MTVYLADGKAYASAELAAWLAPGQEIVPVEHVESFSQYYYVERHEDEDGYHYTVRDCAPMPKHNEAAGYYGTCYFAFDEAHALLKALKDPELKTVPEESDD